MIFVLGIISIFYPVYLFVENTAREWLCCLIKDRAVVNYKDDYDDHRLKFENEYDRANPITKEQAREDYLEFIKSMFSLKYKGPAQISKL